MVEMDDGLVYDNKPKEIEIILDEKLNKKVKKVLKKMTDDIDKNCKIIEKAFGSLDFKDEYGNSLAHLFIINTYRNSANVKKAIRALDIVERISEKNCNGDDFLQYFVKNFKNGPAILENVYYNLIKFVDVNSSDRDGNTLLHNCVLKCMDLSIIVRLYGQCLMFDYTSSKNNNGETFYDILERKYNKIMDKKNMIIISGENSEYYFESEGRKLLYEDFEANMIHIKKIYFKNNPSAIFDRFTNDDEENRKLMEYYVSDVDPLFMATEASSKVDFLNIIEKLLKLGENPNKKDSCNKTFINYVISNYRDFEIIFKTIELAIKYGYDLNNSNIQGLIKELNSHDLPYEEELYIFISKFGYKNIEKDYIGAYDDNSDAQKGFKDFRIRCFIKIFNIESSKFNLVSTINNIRDNKFFDMIFELIDSFQTLFGFNNDYEFIKFLIEEIINERNNNVNLRTDVVDEKEILNTLVSCVNKKTEEKIVKVLKK